MMWTGPARASSAHALLPGEAARLVLVHAALIAGAAVMLFPFVWMLLTSVRPPGEILSNSLNPFRGALHGMQNYSDALSTAPLVRFMYNGVVVCAGILVVQLLERFPASLNRNR
jgi:multiple sugar transport system permease protein